MIVVAVRGAAGGVLAIPAGAVAGVLCSTILVLPFVAVATLPVPPLISTAILVSVLLMPALCAVAGGFAGYAVARAVLGVLTPRFTPPRTLREFVRAISFVGTDAACHGPLLLLVGPAVLVAVGGVVGARLAYLFTGTGIPSSGHTESFFVLVSAAAAGVVALWLVAPFAGVAGATAPWVSALIAERTVSP
ncbi:MAG: hypothetical protein HY904_07155 [Deltaproteobacteria bacterium]|nr:hypothetical protein [Deltaproteobacteria bacterium]